MAKFGEGHVAAMARLGLKELRAAAYPESNIAQNNEVGLYGSPTQGEVAAARKDEKSEPEQEQGSIVEQHVREAESRSDREEPPREQELER